MVKNTAELIAELSVSDRSTMELQLEEAVDAARLKAMQHRTCGILVTRHDYTRFTVELSPEVPFGITREHQAW